MTLGLQGCLNNQTLMDSEDNATKEQMDLIASATRKMFEINESEANHSELVNIVLLGPTGSGKSTLICDMQGQELRKMERSEAQALGLVGAITRLVAKNGAGDICKMGHRSGTSETQDILPYEVTLDGYPFPIRVWDTPGFLDTEGAARQIVHAVNRQGLLKFIKSTSGEIYVICVVSVDTLTAGHGKVLKDCQDILERLLPLPAKSSNIHWCINKITDSDKEPQEYAETLQELGNGKSIFETIDEKSISLFDPLGITKQDRVSGKHVLYDALQRSPLAVPDQVLLALTSESEVLLQKMSCLLLKNITFSVKNNNFSSAKVDYEYWVTMALLNHPIITKMGKLMRESVTNALDLLLTEVRSFRMKETGWSLKRMTAKFALEQLKRFQTICQDCDSTWSRDFKFCASNLLDEALDHVRKEETGHLKALETNFEQDWFLVQDKFESLLQTNFSATLFSLYMKRIEDPLRKEPEAQNQSGNIIGLKFYELTQALECLPRFIKRVHNFGKTCICNISEKQTELQILFEKYLGAWKEIAVQSLNVSDRVVNLLQQIDFLHEDDAIAVTVECILQNMDSLSMKEEDLFTLMNNLSTGNYGLVIPEAMINKSAFESTNGLPLLEDCKSNLDALIKLVIVPDLTTWRDNIYIELKQKYDNTLNNIYRKSLMLWTRKLIEAINTSHHDGRTDQTFFANISLQLNKVSKCILSIKCFAEPVELVCRDLNVLRLLQHIEQQSNEQLVHSAKICMMLSKQFFYRLGDEESIMRFDKVCSMKCFRTHFRKRLVVLLDSWSEEKTCLRRRPIRLCDAKYPLCKSHDSFCEYLNDTLPFLGETNQTFFSEVKKVELIERNSLVSSFEKDMLEVIETEFESSWSVLRQNIHDEASSLQDIEQCFGVRNSDHSPFSLLNYVACHGRIINNLKQCLESVERLEQDAVKHQTTFSAIKRNLEAELIEFSKTARDVFSRLHDMEAIIRKFSDEKHLILSTLIHRIYNLSVEELCSNDDPCLIQQVFPKYACVVSFASCPRGNDFTAYKRLKLEIQKSTADTLGRAFKSVADKMLSSLCEKVARGECAFSKQDATKYSIVLQRLKMSCYSGKNDFSHFVESTAKFIEANCCAADMVVNQDACKVMRLVRTLEIICECPVLKCAIEEFFCLRSCHERLLGYVNEHVDKLEHAAVEEINSTATELEQQLKNETITDPNFPKVKMYIEQIRSLEGAMTEKQSWMEARVKKIESLAKRQQDSFRQRDTWALRETKMFSNNLTSIYALSQELGKGADAMQYIKDLLREVSTCFRQAVGEELRQSVLKEFDQSGCARSLIDALPEFKYITYELYNKKAGGVPFEKALKALIKAGRELSASEEINLKASYYSYKKVYDEHVTSILGGPIRQFDTSKIVRDIDETAINIKRCFEETECSARNLLDWSGNLLGAIAALWTFFCMNPEVSAYSRITVSSPDSSFSNVPQPHATQVLAILMLLSVDDGFELRNNMIQIGTGEGKSIALGLTALFLSKIGFPVDIVCYSSYLSERDDVGAFDGAFSRLRSALGETNNIRYMTIKEAVEMRLVKNTRSDFQQFLLGNQCGGHTHRSSGRSASEDGFHLLWKNAKSAVKKQFRRIKDAGHAALEAIVRRETSETDTCSGIGPPRILLFDEIDVFFTNSFFGSVHRSVFRLDLASTLDESLVHYIWRNRTNEAVLQSLEESVPVRKLQERFRNLTVQMLDLDHARAVVKMFTSSSQPEVEYSDLKAFNYRFEQDSDCYQIKYVDADLGQEDETVAYGYLTDFTLFYECEKRSLNFDKYKKSKTPYVTSGHYLYSALLSNYCCVLGMSGTLTSLGKGHRDLLDSLDLHEFSILPSTFERRKKPLVLDPFFTAIESQFCKQIAESVSDKRLSNRAVLIFVDGKSEEQIAKRIESIHSAINQLCGSFVINRLLYCNSPEEKTQIIQQAVQPKAVTFVARKFGRGTDFVCRNEVLVTKGGVHLIITFFPEDETEETQILGRTCRQDDPGSVEFVLLEQDFENEKMKKVVEDGLLEDSSGPKTMLDSLKTIRSNLQAEKAEKMRLSELKNKFQSKRTEKFYNFYRNSEPSIGRDFDSTWWQNACKKAKLMVC